MFSTNVTPENCKKRVNIRHIFQLVFIEMHAQFSMSGFRMRNLIETHWIGFQHRVLVADVIILLNQTIREY